MVDAVRAALQQLCDRAWRNVRATHQRNEADSAAARCVACGGGSAATFERKITQHVFCDTRCQAMLWGAHIALGMVNDVPVEGEEGDGRGAGGMKRGPIVLREAAPEVLLFPAFFPDERLADLFALAYRYELQSSAELEELAMRTVSEQFAYVIGGFVLPAMRHLSGEVMRKISGASWRTFPRSARSGAASTSSLSSSSLQFCPSCPR